MKEAYYFSHDTNARTDPKIMAMVAQHKAAGYGWFWMTIEMMAQQPEYKLRRNTVTYIALSSWFLTDADTVESFIKCCIEDFELFEANDRYFWSESLCRRMGRKHDLIEKRREIGRRGGLKSGQVRQAISEIAASAIASKQLVEANVNQLVEANEAKVEAKRSSVEANEPKERKGKEKKVKERKTEEPPLTDPTIPGFTYVLLTVSARARLDELYGCECVDFYLEQIENYIGEVPSQRAGKYESHEHVVRNWVNRDRKKQDGFFSPTPTRRSRDSKDVLERGKTLYQRMAEKDAAQ